MHVYEIFRWVLAVPLTLFGSWIVILNFVIVYRWWARREHHSFVPLFGGFLAFIGLGLCPLRQVQRFAWVPLAVDIVYCVLTLTIGFAAMLLKGNRRDADAESQQ
jgi:hypothetical protein